MSTTGILSGAFFSGLFGISFWAFFSAKGKSSKFHRIATSIRKGKAAAPGAADPSAKYNSKTARSPGNVVMHPHVKVGSKVSLC